MSQETTLCLHCMTQVSIDTTIVVGTHLRTKREYRLCKECYANDPENQEEALRNTENVVNAIVA